MGKLSYSSIFSNVNKYDSSGSYTGIQIASKLNQKNGQDYPLLDAIDIDWDGAWLIRLNTYINTSYDLLNIIDRSIDLDNIQWLNENMNTVLGDYVSYSYLKNDLSKYQKLLIPGDNISISQNNIISTYGVLSETVADTKYTYSYTFTSFRQYVLDRMFDYQQDDRYNNLEKIYEWIINLERYVPVNYEDINLSENKYYIYNEPTDEYIRVNIEYILNNKDIQYYAAQEITKDISDLLARVEIIESTIGNKIYDPNTDTYSYTGIRNDINSLYVNSRILSDNIGSLYGSFQRLEEIVGAASAKSVSAYNLAYSSTLLSEATNVKVDEAIIKFSSAYDMAYYSAYSVGNKYSPAYYTPITDEDRERLIEDPTYIDTYIYFEGDDLPTKVRFNKTSTVQYYKYIPEVVASGMFKEIDEIRDVAENSLFNLSVESNGSSYINMNISPDENDGTNKRKITLNTIESIIDKDNGYIYQEGIITTDSLKNTITYHSYIYDIKGANDNIDGLIIGI